MKLVKIEGKYVRKGLPTVHFSVKGPISFSKEAARMIGLNEDSRVSFYNDIDNPEDWYLCKDSEGMKLRKGTTTGFICNNAFVAKSITNKNGRAIISSSLVDGMYWPIITKTLKK